MPKGVYKRFRTIGKGKLRHYSKHYVREVTYDINPSDDNVEAVKEDFPSWMDNVPFRKGRPKVSVEGDNVVWKYKRKPTTYFDIRKGTFKVTSEDYRKYRNDICNNQSQYALENIKKFSDAVAIGNPDKAYIKVKYKKRKRRTRGPFESRYFNPFQE